MAAALLAVMACVTLAATRIPTPALVALDAISLAWLVAVGAMALSGWCE